MSSLSSDSALIKVLREIARTIGPEAIIPGNEQEKYPFEDNLKCSERYFYSGMILKNSVFDKDDDIKGKISHNSSFQIADKLLKKLYQRVKERNQTVENTLDNYIITDDLTFAVEALEQILKTFYGKYKVFLITNLIDLRGVDSLNIGDVALKKINDDYLIDWPNQISDQGGVRGLLSVPPFLSKEQFLEKYKQHIAFETVITGYHFEGERSLVFDTAVNNFKQVFAFLYSCKHFLENIKNPFTIEAKSIGEYYEGLISDIHKQQYYIKSISQPEYLKKIELFFGKPELSADVFIIDKNAVEKISSDCFLEKYNELRINKKGDINKKVSRSLDWYLKSVLEQDLTDEAISLFISLESLLTLDTNPLTSHTDDMAENIAIMLTSDPDERFEYKKKFKNVIYPLRNKIFHHGSACTVEKDIYSIYELRSYAVWSLRGILSRLDDIFTYGEKVQAMREYFERLKLKCR